MGKPMKVKFINKKGEWVEELCHDPTTCREHRRKVADTKKSLLSTERIKDVHSSLDENNPFDDSLSSFNYGDYEKFYNDNEDDIVNCRSAGGAANCKYHSELYKIEKQLNECYARVQENPSKENLDEYVELSASKNNLIDLVAISEHNDFTAGLKTINPDFDNEMKTVLTEKMNSLPIEDISWTEYLQAAVNFTSAQSYGAQVEAVYRRKKGYEKVLASEEKGDAFDPVSNKNLEIKFTVLSRPYYKYDIVQIRPHHDIDSYHIIAFSKDDNVTEFYVLTKKQMTEELIKTGKKLAHGSLKNNSNRTYPEYSIRFKRGSETHKRWQKYLKPVDWK